MRQRTSQLSEKCVPRPLSTYHHLTRFGEMSNTSASSFLHSILNCLHKHDSHNNFFCAKLNILSASQQMIDQICQKSYSCYTFGGNYPRSCCNQRLELKVEYFVRKINETDHMKLWFHKFYICHSASPEDGINKDSVSQSFTLGDNILAKHMQELLQCHLF